MTVGRSLRDGAHRRATPNSAAATIEEALHSYFAVSDVRRVRIHGLEGVGYVDKTAAMARKPGRDRADRDRRRDRPRLPRRDGTVTIEDPGWRGGSSSRSPARATTVVWNPWIAKAKAMPDFGDDEWTGMVCVETANAGDDAVTLAPGASHAMTATFEALASP